MLLSLYFCQLWPLCVYLKYILSYLPWFHRCNGLWPLHWKPSKLMVARHKNHWKTINVNGKNAKLPKMLRMPKSANISFCWPLTTKFQKPLQNQQSQWSDSQNKWWWIQGGTTIEKILMPMVPWKNINHSITSQKWPLPYFTSYWICSLT